MAKKIDQFDDLRIEASMETGDVTVGRLRRDWDAAVQAQLDGAAPAGFIPFTASAHGVYARYGITPRTSQD